MTDNTETLVVEILRKIQTDIAALREGQSTTNQRLSAIEHHMAGFHVNVAHQSEEVIALKNRIDRIERRLGLADA